MRRYGPILLVVLASLSTAHPAQSFPQHVWSRQFGGSAIVEVFDVAVDANGNIVVCGAFAGTLNTVPPVVSDAGGDPFVLSLDGGAATRWVRKFATSGQNRVIRVATDAAGNVVLTGFFTGSIDFGGGALATAGGSDICLAKLDTNGNHVWSKRFGELDAQGAQDVAVDSDGSIVIGGTMKGQFSFGGPNVGFCPAISQCSDGDDVFLARFAPDGTHIWSVEFNSLDTQAARALALNSSGEVFLVGGYQGANFDAGGGPLPAPQPFNCFVIKTSSTGVHLWSKGFGIDGQVQVSSVAVDPAGNPMIGGHFLDTVSFGGGTLTVNTGDDAFLASFNGGDGTHRWSRALYGNGNQNVAGIAIDADAIVYTCGWFYTELKAGGATHTNDGFWNPYLAMYDTDGSFEESGTYASVQDSFVNGVALVPGGGIVTVGTFDNKIDLGGGMLTNTGPADLYVAKYAPAPVPVLITEFNAKARTAHIELAWRLWSDETLESFTLYRRGESDRFDREIASGSLSGLTQSHADRDVQPGATYHYSLVIRSRDGDEIRSQTASATMPPLAAALGRSSPNPFRTNTAFEYTIAERGAISIGIYDVRGARVVLLDQGVREPGSYRAAWDGKSISGAAVPSGVYFYRIEGMPAVEAQRLILVR